MARRRAALREWWTISQAVPFFDGPRRVDRRGSRGGWLDLTVSGLILLVIRFSFGGHRDEIFLLASGSERTDRTSSGGGGNLVLITVGVL